MYIIVKYGDKEEGIFNPNCKCVTLLNRIKDHCQETQWNTDVDLSDESGNLKHLREFPHRYASDLLEERENLVLIKITRNDSHTNYVPLLNDRKLLTEEFYAQLTRELNSNSQPNKRNKSSKSRGDSPMKEPKIGSSKSTKSSKPSLSRSSSKLKS